ncbi:MAG: 2-phosphosulfolactate phosphatase [Bacteroidales bacterium]|nr:2-phosphosulfolactate phosphatase [Bacteroidales bacterium]
MTRNIDIVPAPPLYACHPKGGTVVLIDALRFTSTLTTALANGALWAETYADADKAIARKKDGYIVAGERNGEKLKEFHYNNSPVAMTRQNIGGKKLAFVTTNGTYMRSIIQEYDAIYAGCFLNARALISRLIAEQNDVQLVCSGATNRIAVEDFVFAGLVANALMESQQFSYEFDTVAMAISMYHQAKDNISEYVLNNAPRIKKTCALFEHYRADFEFSFQHNLLDVVPEEVSPFKFVIKK